MENAARPPSVGARAHSLERAGLLVGAETTESHLTRNEPQELRKCIAAARKGGGGGQQRKRQEKAETAERTEFR